GVVVGVVESRIADNLAKIVDATGGGNPPASGGAVYEGVEIDHSAARRPDEGEGVVGVAGGEDYADDGARAIDVQSLGTESEPKVAQVSHTAGGTVGRGGRPAISAADPRPDEA